VEEAISPQNKATVTVPSPSGGGGQLAMRTVEEAGFFSKGKCPTVKINVNAYFPNYGCDHWQKRGNS
jgi:hypothetical protein